MHLKPHYDGWTVKLPNVHGGYEDIGDLNAPATVDRLVAVKTFVYEADAGPVSVRLERKRRGSEIGYWVAYKRHAGKLHKTYVCEAYALDAFNIDYAAVRLFRSAI